jgi:hypothetical protein
MKNRHLLIAGLLAISAFPAIADTVKSQTTMTFSSIPIAEDLRTTAHKIVPYRSEDRVIVIVVDPIMCEQKPINPRFEIRDSKISLRYDLTVAPAGATQGCTAHSTFDLKNVPHGEFYVEFQGGNERMRSAKMVPCPNTQPVVDAWDCVAPAAKTQTTMTFSSIPTVGEDLGTIGHKILAYWSEARVIVIVVDPIMCGQKPINPRFEIKDHKISLRYDLATAPAGAKMGCTAHSTFDLENVPHGDVQVEFEGGDERVHPAKMARCPNTEPVMDIWDCIAPLK